MTALVRPATVVAIAWGLVFAQNGKAPETKESTEKEAVKSEEKKAIEKEQQSDTGEKETPEPSREKASEQKKPAPSKKTEEKAEKPAPASKNMTPQAEKSAEGVTVSRAAVAPAIEDREPVGAGETFAKDGVDRLYFFTQVTGVRDTLQIEHRWYHDENLVQTTKLPVRSMRWRTYSSHSIGDQSDGSWKVEAVNTETDEVMESVSFTVN